MTFRIQELIDLASRLGNGDISYGEFARQLNDRIDDALARGDTNTLSWLATQIAKVGP